jgi:hypothetical protein
VSFNHDNPEWRKNRKVITFPGNPATPLQVLARTFDKAQQGKLKSVYVAIQWADGSFNNDWSTMSTTDMMMHIKTAEKQLDLFWEKD